MYTPRRGDLVTVETEEDLFGVAKILEVDNGGVHVRLYVQRFSHRPTPTEIGALSTAPNGPGHDNPISVGHLPLSFGSFSGWEPNFLSAGEVVEDELEGYRMWVEAEGGYF